MSWTPIRTHVARKDETNGVRPGGRIDVDGVVVLLDLLLRPRSDVLGNALPVSHALQLDALEKQKLPVLRSGSRERQLGGISLVRTPVFGEYGIRVEFLEAVAGHEHRKSAAIDNTRTTTRYAW
jgi:hypothetical protein